MTRSKHARLRIPIAIGLMGTALAIAVGVSRGAGAGAGIEVATALITAYFYQVGGGDSDLGAVIGSRADERQRMVKLRSEALALRVMTLAALIGWTAAIALKATYWPFDVIFSGGGVAFLIGLRVYGVHEDGSLGSMDSPQDGFPRPQTPGNG